LTVGNWIVRSKYTVTGLTIEDLEDIVLGLGGGTVYDHTTGYLTLSYVVSAVDVQQAAGYALTHPSRLPPLKSLELRTA
jgi:hypothetical protein